MTATVVSDPPPPPAPVPERTVNGALWIAVLGLAALQAWPIVAPLIPRPDPWVSLGKAYRADTASAYAVGWDAGAASLESGKAMTEAQAAFQTAWLKARTDAFQSKVAPALAKVLPEGAEPTPDQRVKTAAAWRGLAKGLRTK